MKETGINQMDLRNAAEERLSKFKVDKFEEITLHRDNFIDELIEFAQSHRSLNKGEVPEEQIQTAAQDFAENCIHKDHPNYREEIRWFKRIFIDAVKWRESLSEQPEAKPTESEQVEKLKEALERIAKFWTDTPETAIKMRAIAVEILTQKSKP